MNRRSFFCWLAALLAVATGTTAQQPQSQRFPPFPPEEPPGPKIDPRLILRENQKELRRQTLRLWELADQLRKDVEKTDTTEVFSVQLYRTAEEIEKLARQIKNLLRG
jgi:hypothetical protein